MAAMWEDVTPGIGITKNAAKETGWNLPASSPKATGDERRMAF
jgi:hypothetical protein